MGDLELDKLTDADFAGHVGEPFTIHDGDAGAVRGKLLEVHLAPYPASAPGKRRAFSVVFGGPLRPVLPQAIYRVENERMGAMEVFLVPVGPRDGGMEYEAVFT